ncbi:MAG: hypothetical protein VX341_01015 [Bdellovibrionota bacterium]|nr:hypothetical protein [Bdellovibrionota bacterium]
MKLIVLILILFQFHTLGERVKVKGNRVQCLSDALSRLLSNDGKINSPALEGTAYAHDIVEIRRKIFQEFYEPNLGTQAKLAKNASKRKIPDTNLVVKPHYKGRIETLVRYVSFEEAQEIIKTSSLHFKNGHNKGEKWIGTPKSIDPHHQLGKKKSHKYKVEMKVEKGTINWLRQFEIKPDVEPNRFGIPFRSLNDFNNRIVSIDITTI